MPIYSESSNIKWNLTLIIIIIIFTVWSKNSNYSTTDSLCLFGVDILQVDEVSVGQVSSLCFVLLPLWPEPWYVTENMLQAVGSQHL